MAGDNISFAWGCRRDTKVLFWFTQRSDHIQLSGLPFASAFLGFAATDDNEAAILPSLFVILLASLWVSRYALVDDRVSNFEVVRVVDPLLIPPASALTLSDADHGLIWVVLVSDVAAGVCLQ